MTKSRINPKVDFYFIKAKKWQEEIKKLRKVDRKKLEEIAAKYDNQKILKNALQTIKANLSK